MDVHDIRRENLIDVIAKNWGGVSARLANAIGCKKTVISRLISDRHTRKNMGDNIARRIEAASNLPHGWMDISHGAAAATSDSSTVLADLIRSLSEDDQRMIEAMIALAASRRPQGR